MTHAIHAVRAVEAAGVGAPAGGWFWFYVGFGHWARALP